MSDDDKPLTHRVSRKTMDAMRAELDYTPPLTYRVHPKTMELIEAAWKEDEACTETYTASLNEHLFAKPVTWKELVQAAQLIHDVSTHDPVPMEYVEFHPQGEMTMDHLLEMRAVIDKQVKEFHRKSPPGTIRTFSTSDYVPPDIIDYPSLPVNPPEGVEVTDEAWARIRELCEAGIDPRTPPKIEFKLTPSLGDEFYKYTMSVNMGFYADNIRMPIAKEACEYMGIPVTVIPEWPDDTISVFTTIKDEEE